MCTVWTHTSPRCGWRLENDPLKQQKPGLGGDRLWTQRAWRCLCSTPHQQQPLPAWGTFPRLHSPHMMYQTGLLQLQLMKIPCPNQVKEKGERENIRRLQRKYPRMRRLTGSNCAHFCHLLAHILLGSDFMVASGCWGSIRLVPWCQCRGSHLLVTSTETLGFILIGPLTS